mmetsp:Transcript_57192/g.139425  ORF Transcript_57192/g.139425 Transcript_57192/m.139425 type:complete len:431 (-) Transcript_57192:840-2132(-)
MKMASNSVVQLLAVAAAVLLLVVSIQETASFTFNMNPHIIQHHQTASSRIDQHQLNQRVGTSLSSTATTAAATKIEATKQAVDKLKKVLEREYVSFFDPMEKNWYATDVSFTDPMTSLSGVDAYQGNVDMLASRDSLLGSILFDDAGIALHSVAGGEVDDNTGNIENIMTRWTLRVTVKALPWKPTARFTGVSVYEVSTGGPEGVLVNHQTDYWDSINIQKGGSYKKVDTITAVKDFLDQLKPDNGNAAVAGVELPYQLLRRGKDYEVRRYPAFTAAKIPYSRRDEGYDALATITAGVQPLAPAVMEVPNDDSAQKTMSWPLGFAPPGTSDVPPAPKSVLDKSKEPMWSDCVVGPVDSTVVAVGSFSDASVAPIVRKADKQLREALSRDGISVPQSSSSSVKFAQFDAIFSLGKRRGEVWIELEEEGHPW